MQYFETPLNDLDTRSKCAREISRIFDNQGLTNWIASAPATRPEIFIRPKDDTEWSNLPAVTRMSVQIKENILSFGVSGYFPWQIKFTKSEYEALGYKYHDKGYTEDGRTKGRWWLTKEINNIESLANEIKKVEPLLYKK
jgi:hypothetical protein